MRTDRDDCVTSTQIKEVHLALVSSGIDDPLVELAQRESALAAYVILSAAHLADTARICGAPSAIAEWLERETQVRMLVCLKAQRQAQYELWRDMMGDEPDQPESKGGRP